MDNNLKNLFNLAFDNLYNLNSKLNNVLGSKINILLEEIEKEVLNYGYEFKLNQKTQKFRLCVIK